jgi:hypothetical protein
VVGSEYLALLALKKANGSAVSTPVRWSLVSGALPDGLVFEDSTAETEALSGTPQKTGLFIFRVEAVDARGRVAGLNAVVLVWGASVSISGFVPQTLAVGDTVSAQLVATPAQVGNEWFIRDGHVPPGLSLSVDGVLSGSVNTPGSYTFTVGVGTSRTQLRGLATSRVDVTETSPKKPTGCASTTGVNLLLSVLFLAKSLRKPRRQ